MCTVQWPSLVAKTEKFFVYEEKKFGRIDSRRGKPVSDIRRLLMKNVGPLNLYCFDSFRVIMKGESASLLLSSPGLPLGFF